MESMLHAIRMPSYIDREVSHAMPRFTATLLTLAVVYLTLMAKEGSMIDSAWSAPARVGAKTRKELPTF